MYSEQRQALAMIVSVGLTPVGVGKGDPSRTNRFSTSCAWHHSLRTVLDGSEPIRTVPCWWHVLPVARWPRYDGNVLRALAATRISAFLSTCHFARATSLGCDLWVMRATGKPHASVTSGSRSTRFDSTGMSWSVWPIFMPWL